ncbi:MAG: hypothetical protein ACI9DS_002819, partial [Glaciecola sp.]
LLQPTAGLVYLSMRNSPYHFNSADQDSKHSYI